MNILPLQAWGLGDCIFTQTLAHYLAGPTGKIIWPVKSHFWEGLSRAYPSINWQLEDFIPSIWYDLKQEERVSIATIGQKKVDAIIYPFRWADQILKVPYNSCMRAKYDLYGLDWQRWREQAAWCRYSERERDLMRLNRVVPGDKYNLISETYGSDLQLNSSIEIDNSLRNIRVRAIESYSLFDWAILMEHATEIHFVASSNIYLLEMLDLQAEKICIYPRKPILHHEQYRYIMTKHKYTFI